MRPTVDRSQGARRSRIHSGGAAGGSGGCAASTPQLNDTMGGGATFYDVLVEVAPV